MAPTLWPSPGKQDPAPCRAPAQAQCATLSGVSGRAVPGASSTASQNRNTSPLKTRHAANPSTKCLTRTTALSRYSHHKQTQSIKSKRATHHESKLGQTHRSTKMPQAAFAKCWRTRSTFTLPPVAVCEQGGTRPDGTMLLCTAASSGGPPSHW